MTLEQMADYVCRKTRQTDAESVSDCKAFVRRRYEMIYNDQLWRDSLYGYDFTLAVTGVVSESAPNNTTQGAAGIWFLPDICDKLVALRSVGNEMGVRSEEELFRMDLDAYAQTGTPVDFILMRPAVFMKLGDVPAPLTLHWADASDAGQVVTVTWIDREHRKKKRQITVTADATEFETDTIGVREVESVTKPTTNGNLVLTDPDAGTAVYGQPEDTKIRAYKRFRVMPAPLVNTEMRALVKAKVTPLEDDDAEPIITGVDNLLIVFAQADMLERGRQYAKADVKGKEAGALYTQLQAQQIYQQASNVRFMPQVLEQSGAVEELQSKGIW